jgi:hypothetical protein
MTTQACEPQLRDVLNDPIVQILMSRDAVVESTLLEAIDDIRRRMTDSEEIAAETLPEG